jgi:hypothetical protein
LFKVIEKINLKDVINFKNALKNEIIEPIERKSYRYFIKNEVVSFSSKMQIMTKINSGDYDLTLDSDMTRMTIERIFSF